MSRNPIAKALGVQGLRQRVLPDVRRANIEDVLQEEMKRAADAPDDEEKPNE